MVKLYFDWNVIAQMKNGMHNELNELVSNNDMFLIPYSTSHISDIFSSFKDGNEQNELINSDLDFLGKLTNNTFLFNTGNEVLIEYAPPINYFNQLVDQKDMFSDISLNGLFKNLLENDLTKNIGEVYLDLLKNYPLDNEFKEAFENPEIAKQLEIIFPGLKENLTMEGFFQSFSELQRGLNEDLKYKDLRKVVQTGLGINRDKIFDSQVPFKLIQSQYQMIGQDPFDQSTNDKNAPSWFSEITNEYIRLDIHGYQEDNVNVSKGRKETFKNTIEDAFHAAFSTTCNFYIINDKKSYKKTKQVFDKLKINTIILKPDEFIKYYNSYLNFEDKNLNLDIVYHLLINGEFHEEKLESGSILRTYYFPFFIFGFFTKLIHLIPDSKETPVLLLGRNKPTNGYTYVFEIEKLVKDISSLLGNDIEGIGDIKKEEFDNDNWVGRSWKMETATFKLTNLNGHFQLYIYFADS